MGRVCRACVCAMAFWWACASIGAAQTWTGGGADSNWSTAANWSGGVVPANDGSADIVLLGPGNLNPIVDVPWNIHSLSFANSAVFSLSGSELSVGEIHNPDNTNQTISNNISFSQSLSLNVSGNIGMSGVIAGAGSMTKTGGGTLTLSGASTYSGGTTVQSGTLLVTGFSPPPGSDYTISSTGRGDVSVLAGATLAGNSYVSGNVILQTDARLSPGPQISSLAVGGLTLNTGAHLMIESNGNVDRISVLHENALNIAGRTEIDLNTLQGTGSGISPLIDYYGQPLSDSAINNLYVVDSGGYYTGRVFHDAESSTIDLRIFYWQARPMWGVDASGSWGEQRNWQTLDLPDNVGYAEFSGIITSPRTITLDGNRSVGQIYFDNANRYTIAPGTGGMLTINGQFAKIDVTSGSHVISAPVRFATGATMTIGSSLALSGGIAIAAGKEVVKTGGGTLTIGGPQSHDGGASLEVGRGKLILNSDAGAGGAHLMLKVSGDSGGSAQVVLGADQHLAELSINVAAAFTQGLDLNSPATAGGFYGVSIYSADLQATKTALWAAIRHANAAGVPDPQDGIYDSGKHVHSAVGIALLEDHVLIRSTRVGDLNLDGQVSIADFIDLAANFNTISTATWQEGDLNYDGNVSVSDFIDLASNFSAPYSGQGTAITPQDAKALNDFAAAHGVSVPEPGMSALSIMTISAVGLGRRQRRA